MTEITRDEWLKALDDANASGHENEPGVMTCAELADMLGCSKRHVQTNAEKMLKAGTLVPARKHVKNSSGVWRVYPAYKLVAKPRKAGK